MLRSLSGTVLGVGEPAQGGQQCGSVWLDVSGLGFDVLASRSACSMCTVGQTVRLIVHLQISEAGAAIYGFSSERERELFLKITSIKGVGGRTGMAILSSMSADEVLRAVALADVSSFTHVPGVGKKTAERLCFELQRLIPADGMISGSEQDAAAPLIRTSAVSSVTEALLSLGFSQVDASGVMAMLRAAHGADFDSLDEETLLRASLRELRKKG